MRGVDRELMLEATVDARGARCIVVNAGIAMITADVWQCFDTMVETMQTGTQERGSDSEKTIGAKR